MYNEIVLKLSIFLKHLIHKVLKIKFKLSIYLLKANFHFIFPFFLKILMILANYPLTYRPGEMQMKIENLTSIAKFILNIQ